MNTAKVFFFFLAEKKKKILNLITVVDMDELKILS